MSQITVLTTNGRRQKVPVTPNTTIIEIIQTVCEKHGLSPDAYELKHHRTILDSTSTFRFSGVPLNAQLELVEAKNVRVDSTVILCLQLESGERIQGESQPSNTMWDAVYGIAPDIVTSMTNPVVVYMRREIVGKDALSQTNLKSVGLIGGRAILRLFDKTLDELRTQANVSAPLTRPVPQNKEEKAEGKESAETLSKIDETPSKTISEASIEKNLVLNVEDSGTSKVEPATSTDVRPSSENGVSTSMEISQEEEKPLSVKDVVATPMECEPMHKEDSEEAGGKRVRLSSSDQSEELPLEKVLLLGSRNAVAYNQDSALPVKEIDLPDDFFELTLAEVRSLAAEARRRVQQLEEAPLLTAQQRQLEEDTSFLQKINGNKSCVIRIRFPDRTVLQGCFKPLELVSTVYDFAKKYLGNPNLDFYLYTTPPKLILKPECRLIEVNCVPSAIVYLGLNDTNAQRPDTYLNNEVLSNFSSPLSALQTSLQVRGKTTTKETAELSEASTSKVSATVRNANMSGSTSEKSQKIPKWFKGVK